MRRKIFNNSYLIDQVIYAFVGLLMVGAFSEVIVELPLPNMPIEYHSITRFSFILMAFLFVFFVMSSTAKQTRKLGHALSIAINSSLIKDGDTVYARVSKPKRKEVSGTIDLKKSSSSLYTICSSSGKTVSVPIQNIVKIFDEI